MCLIIRRANPSDVDAMSSILREAFSEFRPLYTEGGYAATTPAPPVLLSRLDEGPSWIAFSGTRAVATVSVVATDDGLYIRSMAVLPSERGKGIANKLLDIVTTYGLENGWQKLLLSTTPFLHSAIALYKNYGFVKSEAGAKDLYGTPLFTMYKDL